MPRPFRFLSTAIRSSSTVVTESPRDASLKSDFTLILAALICALVCVVGFIAVAYCTWVQRRLRANRTAAQQSAASNGIEKKLVEAIPKFTYDPAKEEKGGDCVICLVEYADRDEVRVLPQCGHRFHIGCIDKWLGSRSSCPSCRQIVVIEKCKNCGDFPIITAEHYDGSSSVNKVDGT